MKTLQAAIFCAALVGAAMGGPISMSNNNIGDIVKVDVEAEVDIKSEINVELVNVIAELLLELRDVNVNVCSSSSSSSSSESDSSSSSSSSSESDSSSSSSESDSSSSSSSESSEESVEVTSGPSTTTGTLPPPTTDGSWTTTEISSSIGPGTQTSTVPATTAAGQDAVPYQQLVRSLAQTKPTGYDAPGLTKEQKEQLWRVHVEKLVQDHMASRQ